jgi:hypothetical protein
MSPRSFFIVLFFPEPCTLCLPPQVHFLLAYRGVSVHNARKETDNGYAQYPVLAADACCLSRSCRLLTGSLSGTGLVPRRCERSRHCGSRDFGGEGV